MPTPLTLRQGMLLVAPFVIGVGVCYAYGFWGHFDIDIFQYISLTDVGKLAVFPLIFLAVTAVVQTAFNAIVLRAVFPIGGGNDSPIGRFGFKYWRPLMGASILLMVVAGLLTPEPWRWYVVAFFLVLFSAPLTHHRWVIDLLPNPEVRAVAMLQLLLLPALAFAYGRTEALGVTERGSGRALDVSRTPVALLDQPGFPAILLGRLGTTYFCYERLSGEVVAFTLADGATLVFRRHGGR